MTKEVEIRLSKLNRNKSIKIAQFIFSLVIIQKLVFFTHKISCFLGRFNTSAFKILFGLSLFVIFNEALSYH